MEFCTVISKDDYCYFGIVSLSCLRRIEISYPYQILPLSLIAISQTIDDLSQELILSWDLSLTRDCFPSGFYSSLQHAWLPSQDFIYPTLRYLKDRGSVLLDKNSYRVRWLKLFYCYHLLLWLDGVSRSERQRPVVHSCFELKIACLFDLFLSSFEMNYS